MFKLNQFSHGDQLVLNTARSVGYRVALVVTGADGLHAALAVGHNAAALRDPGQHYAVVPLEEVEGL